MSTRFPTKVDIEDGDRTKLVDLLNVGLANSLDLYSQVKQAHWNVRGMFFYGRHELFDEIAEHLETHADDLAERAGTLGGYANGTVRQSGTNSEIPEYDFDATTAKQHLAALSERFSEHAQWVRGAIEQTQQIDDVATEDLFTEVLRDVEQDLWFLQSHLQD